MCLRDTKGPVHFFIYQSPWPVSQNREIFSKPACPSLFLFIYFPELFQSVVCFPHYSFQTKSLVFLYTFLLAIPLLCPPLRSLLLSHPCLCLSSRLTCCSSSSPFPPERRMRLISLPAHCLCEKWELETLRDTKKAFDTNGIMGWGLNIKKTEGETQNVKWTSEQKDSTT